MNEASPPMDLLPLDILEKAAEVLQVGAIKHGRYDWKYKDPELFKGALLRHLAAIDRNEPYDLEDGMLHSVHALCNAMMYAWHDYRARCRDEHD